MSETLTIAIVATGTATALFVVSAWEGMASRMLRRLAPAARALVMYWREAVTIAEREGRLPEARERRLLMMFAATGSALLLALLLGPAGVLIGPVVGVAAVRQVLVTRRDRYSRRIDEAAGDLALTIAAALTGGHSVRGALAIAGTNLRAPLDGELGRVAADLAFGDRVEDALSGLRKRTGSSRIEILTGSIELHRRAGGDLAALMREFADSFRRLESARDDARAASAQARFTALLVAGIPIAAGLLVEIASPGAVTGAFRFAPSALMLFVAAALQGLGGFAIVRMVRV